MDADPVALHRLLGLLGGALARGPRPDDWDGLRAVLPGLPPVLDDPARAAFEVLAREVPGALSFWRHPDGLATGLALPIRADGLDQPADHVGVVLGALAGAVIDAPAAAGRLVAAVGPAWRAWGAAATGLAGPWADAAALAVEAVGAAAPIPEVPALPLPDPADPELTTRGIVHALLTPARSGYWPTGAALAGFAAAGGVPDGLGPKRQRLTDTLRAAVDGAGAGPVFDAVRADVLATRQRHRALGGSGADLARTERWLAALAGTLRSLRTD